MEQNIQFFSHPVMLYDGVRYIRIDLFEVAYLQADHKSCVMHMCNGKTTHTLSFPLGTIEQQLPPDIFVRIHRSFIINVWHVLRIDGRLIIFDNGLHFTLGEQYLHALDNSFLVIGDKKS